MTLSQIVANSVLKTYKIDQPESGGKFTPRPGFYFITSVFDEDKNGVTIPKAKALYKKIQGDLFIADAEVEIQLLSLFEDAAKGPKYLKKEDLIGKVVNVISCAQSSFYFRGKNHPLIVSKWESTAISPQVATDSDLTITIFMGDENLPEAWKRFETSLSEEVLSALYESYDDDCNQLFYLEEHEDPADFTEFTD